MTEDRNWEITGPDEVVHDGFLRVVRRPLRLAHGVEAPWELLDIPATVTVLAFTPSRDVVMVRQFRPGPGRQVVSLPGGLIDADEDPVTAGLRELTEETGYQAESAEYVRSAHLNNFTRATHIVIAHNCRPTGVQSLDEFEDCTVEVMTLAAVRAELREARLGAGLQTYLALDHLGLL